MTVRLENFHTNGHLCNYDPEQGLLPQKIPCVLSQSKSPTLEVTTILTIIIRYELGCPRTSNKYSHTVCFCVCV